MKGDKTKYEREQVLLFCTRDCKLSHQVLICAINYTSMLICDT